MHRDNWTGPLISCFSSDEDRLMLKRMGDGKMERPMDGRMGKSGMQHVRYRVPTHNLKLSLKVAHTLHVLVHVPYLNTGENEYIHLNMHLLCTCYGYIDTPAGLGLSGRRPGCENDFNLEPSSVECQTNTSKRKKQQVGKFGTMPAPLQQQALN